MRRLSANVLVPGSGDRFDIMNARFPPLVEKWIDAFCDTVDKTPWLLENHGTAVMFTIGPPCILVGYFGAHWINSRQFYRNKTGYTFATYFEAWRVKMFETWFGFGFVGMLLLGFLFIFAGIVDWIDG